jgi:hypothetical protein
MGLDHLTKTLVPTRSSVPPVVIMEELIDRRNAVMHNGAHIFALNCPGNKALSIYDPDHMTKWRNSQSAAHRGGHGGGRGGRGRGDFQGHGRGG